MPCFLPKQRGSNKVVMVNTENQKPTTNYLPIANHCNINTSSSVHLKLKGLMLKSKELNVTGSKIEGSQTPGVPTKNIIHMIMILSEFSKVQSAVMKVKNASKKMDCVAAWP